MNPIFCDMCRKLVLANDDCAVINLSRKTGEHYALEEGEKYPRAKWEIKNFVTCYDCFLKVAPTLKTLS